MHPVRFFKIRGHFCQQLVGGNPDIHGKSKFLPDPVLDLKSRVNRCGKPVGDAGKIEETFVDAELFNVRRVASQKIHQLPAVPCVHLVIRRLHPKGRTFFDG